MNIGDMSLNKLFDAVVLHNYDSIEIEYNLVKDSMSDVQFGILYSIVCRYGNIKTVEKLIKCGATFKTNQSPIKYMIYFLDGVNWLNTNDLYLQARQTSHYERDEFYRHYYRTTCAPNKAIMPMPISNRVLTLDTLLSNFKLDDLDAHDLLFYAIITNNDEIAATLRDRGVKLTIDKINNRFSDSVFYNKFGTSFLTSLIRDPAMPIEQFFEIAHKLLADCPDERIMADTNFARDFNDIFINPAFTDRFMETMSFAKINKKQFMQYNYDVKNFSIYERFGWLNTRKIRDSMIEWSTENKHTELTAWLLDFKNRTADIEKERRNDEIKMQRELMAAPDSAYALRQIWITRKCEGGLCITNYKGDSSIWEIPEKIGKTSVVEVGLSSKANRSSVTSIILPEGIKEFYASSGYGNLSNLEEIKLPSTLNKISRKTFYGAKLKSIEIPANCKVIKELAFCSCPLKNITFNEGLERIEYGAFYDCTSITHPITIPKSVTYISKEAFDTYYGIIPRIRFVVHKDSYGHQWCIDKFGESEKFKYTVID